MTVAVAKAKQGRKGRRVKKEGRKERREESAK
jgi:hypothetical protein